MQAASNELDGNVSTNSKVKKHSMNILQKTDYLYLIIKETRDEIASNQIRNVQKSNPKKNVKDMFYFLN